MVAGSRFIRTVVAGARTSFGDLLGPAAFVVLGCLVCQLGLGFGYALKPLARNIMEEFGWSRSMFFAAQAVPTTVTYALGSLAVGAAVVRFGAKRILVSAILLLTIASLLYSRIESLTQLSMVAIFMSLALTGLGDITVGQLVSQWVVRGRGLALGIVYTGSSLGGYLFIPFALELTERGSWRTALVGLGALAFFVMLPTALFLVRAPRASLGGSLDTSEASTPGDAATTTDLGSDADLDLKQALRTRSFWILAGSLFCFFTYFMGIVDHLVLFLTDEGLEQGAAGQVLRNALGLGIVSKILLGLIADHIPHRRAIQIDFALLSASSMLLLILPASGWAIWSWIITFGFSAAARDVVYPLIITECFGLRNMATIYGALMLSYLPGATLGPVFAAAVHDQTESYQQAFMLFVFLNLLAVAGLFLLRDERQSLILRHAAPLRHD